MRRSPLPLPLARGHRRLRQIPSHLALSGMPYTSRYSVLLRGSMSRIGDVSKLGSHLWDAHRLDGSHIFSPVPLRTRADAVSLVEADRLQPTLF